MLAGIEWIINAGGCDHSRLQDLASLQSLCGKVVADLELKVVGEPQWHKFPFPGGVTGLYLLSESHLACHTYPEYQLATLNLYCCRERQPWNWKDELTDRLGAKTVDIHRLARGYCSETNTFIPSQSRSRTLLGDTSSGILESLPEGVADCVLEGVAEIVADVVIEGVAGICGAVLG